MEPMIFARGDGPTNTKYFWIPTDSWTAGGRLFFAAKQVVDDDTTDAAAEIKGDWGDGAVTDDTIAGVAYKKYTCPFAAVATDSVNSDGADKLDLLGEFQWKPASGDPITFPPSGDKIPVELWFDINRRVTP
jgi:hypothetical protein